FYSSETILAFKYSRFILAIFSSEIPFGHSTSQAPVLEQLPNPSSSICATIFCALREASTLPCGNKANWEIFAPTNNIAEPFLQAATQAPQPMQVAASNDLSASSFGTGKLLASIVFPEVPMETKPPACWILSNDERSTIKSLMTGKATERQGST